MSVLLELLRWGLRFCGRFCRKLCRFTIMCVLFLFCSDTVYGITPSGVHVDNPQAVPNEAAWSSRVTMSQAPGSVVLALLMDVGSNGYSPCKEFSDVCCLGSSLLRNVWGGDVAVLDAVQSACNGGGDGETAFTPLASRTETDVRFSVEELGDTSKASFQTVDRHHDVRLLILVVELWEGCSHTMVGVSCTVRLQGLEQILQVDASDIQQVTTVSIPSRCTSDKPPNALWLPYSITSDSGTRVCEWFCAPDFVRCPGYATVLNTTCSPLPHEGAILHVTVAVRWVNTGNDSRGYLRDLDTLDVGNPLDKISTAVAVRMSAAGVRGVNGCSVIIRGGGNVSTAVSRVDMPVVDGRIRVASDSYHDGVMLRDTLSETPSAHIPTELSNIDDRLLTGFFEFTVLMYSNDTDFSLADQASLLRYVLFETLDDFYKIVDVLYISDVQGVIRGVVEEAFTISLIQALALSLWAFGLLAMSLVALFCPTVGCHVTPSPSIPLTPVESMEPLPPVTCCAQHSPRDRTLITVLILLIVGTLAGSTVVYIMFILPHVQAADSFERPMLMLGWLWCMFLVCIFVVVLCCLIAARARRCV
jgi:hypothetical protein